MGPNRYPWRIEGRSEQAALSLVLRRKPFLGEPPLTFQQLGVKDLHGPGRLHANHGLVRDVGAGHGVVGEGRRVIQRALELGGKLRAGVATGSDVAEVPIHKGAGLLNRGRPGPAPALRRVDDVAHASAVEEVVRSSAPHLLLPRGVRNVPIRRWILPGILPFFAVPNSSLMANPRLVVEVLNDPGSLENASSMPKPVFC